MDSESVNVLKQYIKRNEGLKQVAYRDSGGIYTIGFGHNLQARPLSYAICDRILDEDLEYFLNQIPQHLSFFNKLDFPRQLVLVDLAYNLGIYGLLQFKKFLGALEDGDYDSAAIHLLASTYSKQTGNRANVNARIIREGVINQSEE